MLNEMYSSGTVLHDWNTEDGKAQASRFSSDLTSFILSGAKMLRHIRDVLNEDVCCLFGRSSYFLDPSTELPARYRCHHTSWCGIHGGPGPRPVVLEIEKRLSTCAGSRICSR